MKKPVILVLALLVLLAPLSALAAGPLADGRYTVEAALSGGSGRAGVSSPVKLTVQDGVATATVVWSSPHYQYMRLDGVYYYPVQSDGNSTFEIPVTLDTDIPFAAETVAMSQPHVIEYTLRFDSSTLKPVESGISWTGVLVWAALAALVATGVIFAVTRRGKRAKTGQTP